MKLKELKLGDAWTFENIKDVVADVMRIPTKSRKGNASLIANLAAINELWERIYYGKESRQKIISSIRKKYGTADLNTQLVKEIISRNTAPTIADTRSVLEYRREMNKKNRMEEALVNNGILPLCIDEHAESAPAMEQSKTEAEKAIESLINARDWLNANGYTCEIKLSKILIV